VAILTALHAGLLVSACWSGTANAQDLQPSDAPPPAAPETKEPATGLRGSLDGAPKSTASLPVAAEADHEARLSELERKAEAASRISEFGAQLPPEPKKRAPRKPVGGAPAPGGAAH
jgi:hypothetical protein